MAAPEIPYRIDCGGCTLHLLTSSNAWFIEDLFAFADVKKYYVLRNDHVENIRSFCQNAVAANQQGTCINYLIYDNFGNEVGFISAEPQMNQATNMPLWNMGYAVHPSYRDRGFASSAVNGLTNFLLQNFSIQQVMLDISEDNKASEAVAKKCGFTKLKERTGYFDWNHPEVGMRFRWFKQLAGMRTNYFNQAVQFYRMKMYNESVQAFESALSEPYQVGTPYTDAQIYSNMGMALSSLRRYTEAFQSLKKAQSLGLNNPSIEKELAWLKNNIGLY